jgi:hypothetical protein
MTRFANRRIVPQPPEVLERDGITVIRPKRNLTVREAFQQAFMDIGGVEALAEWARNPENRGAFYSLCARLIPQQLEGSGDPSRPLIIALREEPDE